MSAYSVRFYGGPLAGQIHMILNPPRTYRVLSYTTYSAFSYEHSDRIPMLETEEYELSPSSGPDHQFTYTWINPAAHLRKDLRETREAKEHYRVEAQELRAVVAGLSDDAEKWQTVKRLLGEACA